MASPVSISGPIALVRTAFDRVGRIATVIAPPVLRLALALPFLRFGLTRWDAFLRLSPAAEYLFEE